MGYEPQALPSLTRNSPLPAFEQRIKELNIAREEALAAHKLARLTMKNRIHSKFKPFKIGGNVWLEARNLKHNIINPKFSPKREGPFTITKVLSVLSYQLKLPAS